MQRSYKEIFAKYILKFITNITLSRKPLAAIAAISAEGSHIKR